jgi:predicted O-methyltransferase YrrM
MADFNSYELLLHKYMGQLKPHLIFEWGTGKSTVLMASYPNTQVITIEHDTYWFNIYNRQYQDVLNIKRVYENNSESYVNYPRGLDLKFDLIFIDGLCDTRIDCLKVAREILSDKGIVILHDSEREKYAPGRNGYETLEESEGTAVLKPK